MVTSLRMLPPMRWKRSRLQLFLVVHSTIAAIAYFDYLTGSEVRVYPFYFLPVTLAALTLGRGMAISAACLCAAGWVASNVAGGMHYSKAWIWGWNASMQLCAFLLVAVLVSRIQDALERERAAARKDALTGLYNRRGFQELCLPVLARARRVSSPIALAFVDLDRFKEVNDHFGHEAGDRVLKRAAQTLQECLRGSDILARVGGDEFVVLLPDVTAPQAGEVLERLRATLEEDMRSEGCEVTASFGVVGCGTSSADLIHRADVLMYDVKHGGRNRVQVLLEPQP